MPLKRPDHAPETVQLGSVRSRARTGLQPEIDADALKLQKSWEEAGKPTWETLTALDGDGKASEAFTSANKVWYVVDGDEKADVKKLIRRACLLYKGLPVYAADIKNDDGTFTIGFTYGPPAVKAETEAPAEAVPPAADEAGSTETPDSDQENPDDEAGTGATGRRGFGRRG